MKNVLVTAVGGGAGINALRLLSKYNCVINLYATDSDPLASGQLFANDFKIMSMFVNRKQYEIDLKNLVKEWKIDIVIPTLQEELCDIEEILKDECEVLISDKKTVELCCDKRKFYSWADIEFPELVAKWTTVDKFVDKKSYEQFFMKPAFGRGSSGCKLISEYGVAKGLWANPERIILMDILVGKEYTVDCYISRSGRVEFIVPRERIQTSDGVSLKGRTIKDKKLIDYSREIISKLDFKGPICIQYKEDAHGNPKLLEINPRLSGGHLITVASGANAMECFAQEYFGFDYVSTTWEEKIVIGYTVYETM